MESITHALELAIKRMATRDLAELISLGALVKTGKLRYTRYWLNLK